MSCGGGFCPFGVAFSISASADFTRAAMSLFSEAVVGRKKQWKDTCFSRQVFEGIPIAIRSRMHVVEARHDVNLQQLIAAVGYSR